MATKQELLEARRHDQTEVRSVDTGNDLSALPKDWGRAQEEKALTAAVESASQRAQRLLSRRSSVARAS